MEGCQRKVGHMISHSQKTSSNPPKGELSGVLLHIHDRFKNKNGVAAGGSAYVGLALPGTAGSWQLENKGYQFWTNTDDYKHPSDINITPGSNVDVGSITFEAPRNCPTLWEIGIPDRKSAEFFIPDPNPSFKIHPYPGPVEKFRQYGLWKRYKDYYPKSDVVYTIGQSNHTKDWFFAHVTRNVGGREYEATTWQIHFDLNNVNRGGNYTLQLAIASAHYAEVQVRLNNRKSDAIFRSGLIG